jgi:Calpain family cysteine protease
MLSALAEDPERVKNVFITQKFNSAGIYLVLFYVNGILTPVTVDDYFPVD